MGDRTRYIIDGWLPETPYSESHNDVPPVAGSTAPPETS